MGLVAGTVAIYRREIVLKSGNFKLFSKESDTLSNTINNLIKDPWINLTGLTLTVEVKIEPDPNLNEDFWISVATGKWNG